MREIIEILGEEQIPRPGHPRPVQAPPSTRGREAAAVRGACVRSPFGY